MGDFGVITVTAKFLGGMHPKAGVYQTTVNFPARAPLAHLIDWLLSLGIDPNSGDLIVILDGIGLRQLPEDFCFVKDCGVFVFPVISGG